MSKYFYNDCKMTKSFSLQRDSAAGCYDTALAVIHIIMSHAVSAIARHDTSLD